MPHHGSMNAHNTDRHASERKPGQLTYRQKHAQANREALATVIALVATIVVWIALGFGLSGVDIEIFHTPLWVVGGTVGTWAFSIAVVIALARKVFKNFDLDDVPAPQNEIKEQPSFRVADAQNEITMQREAPAAAPFAHTAPSPLADLDGQAGGPHE